jgi:hypothetical protein
MWLAAVLGGCEGVDGFFWDAAAGEHDRLPEATCRSGNVQLKDPWISGRLPKARMRRPFGPTTSTSALAEELLAALVRSATH